MAGSSATVGTAVIKLSFDGKGVKAELNGVSKEIETAGKASGAKWGGAWAVAAGNLISKGISKISSMVTSTMGGAISRLDSLSNFPKVMTALGYSADEAEKSVSSIGDALDGLPTSLDAAVGDIQKLAATMGNLAEGEVNATSVGLALNDMFLAGGKGTAIASAAMEQYNQMLAAGKVDMQAWRSMVNAAPGQMDQLAKSILGASANQGDLYEAMKKGTVSFEDFNAQIVKLNQEGGEGFESFYNQAVAATGGVATQIENIGNTLNKIVAAALEGNLSDVDKYISQLASRVGAVAPTLIQGFTGAFGALLKALPALFTQLLPVVISGIGSLVQGVVEALPAFVDAIVESIPMIMEGVEQLLGAIMEALPVFFPRLVESVTNGIIMLAQMITQPQFLQMLLGAALTLLMEIVHALPKVLTALIDALPQILLNIIEFLTSPETIKQLLAAAVELFMTLVMAVPQILGSLIQAFGNLVGGLWDGITKMFGEFAANFGEFITGIFKGAINGVLQFIENFINAPIDLLNGFIGIINDAFGWIGVNLGYIDRVQLPRLAQGGVADGATTAIIGESGKEAVIPLENNTDNWAGLLASTLVEEMENEGLEGGGGVTIEKQEFIINNEMDAQDIGRVLMQSIRRAA